MGYYSQAGANIGGQLGTLTSPHMVAGAVALGKANEAIEGQEQIKETVKSRLDAILKNTDINNINAQGVDPKSGYFGTNTILGAARHPMLSPYANYERVKIPKDKVNYKDFSNIGAPNYPGSMEDITGGK